MLRSMEIVNREGHIISGGSGQFVYGQNVQGASESSQGAGVAAQLLKPSLVMQASPVSTNLSLSFSVSSPTP